MFCLSPPEHAALISQIAMSKPGRGGRRKLYEASRALMDTPAPKRRGIGFTADLDESNYATRSAVPLTSPMCDKSSRSPILRSPTKRSQKLTPL